MKITVVGTGNVGSAIAADLSLKKHEVTLLKSTGKDKLNEHQKKLFQSKQIVLKENRHSYTVKLKEVTCSYIDAITSAELIIVTLQTGYHEDFLKKSSRYLTKNQILLFVPGYLSSALIVKKAITNSFIIVEMESSPIDCRIIEPGKVEVLFRNVRNPIGVFPKAKEQPVLNVLSSLSYGYTLRNSVIDSALNNPNLIVHTVGAIMSVPRIEYTEGEYWMYKEVFTPTVWNLVEKLDEEKKQVLNSFQLFPISYLDACKFRNSINLDTDSYKIFKEYAMFSAPKGPNEVNSRYITEDVPNGLVLLETLGEYKKIMTPVCSSLINLANALMNEDFRTIGRTIEWLNIDNIQIIEKEIKGEADD